MSLPAEGQQASVSALYLVCISTFIIMSLPAEGQQSSVSAHVSVVYIYMHNPLPDDNVLDLSKLKQIADDILKCI